MVARTGVEPAGGQPCQPWPAHLSLSGVFSVLAVWRNWQNTSHRRLWRCPNAAGFGFLDAPKSRQPWRTGGAGHGAGGEAHRRKNKPGVGRWLARIGTRSRTWALPARRRRQVVGRREVAAGGAEWRRGRSAWRVGAGGMRTPKGPMGTHPYPFRLAPDGSSP